MPTQQQDYAKIVLVLVWNAIQLHLVAVVFLALIIMEILVIVWYHVHLDGLKLLINVQNVNLLVKIVKIPSLSALIVKLDFI